MSESKEKEEEKDESFKFDAKDGTSEKSSTSTPRGMSSPPIALPPHMRLYSDGAKKRVISPPPPPSPPPSSYSKNQMYYNTPTFKIDIDDNEKIPIVDISDD